MSWNYPTGHSKGIFFTYIFVTNKTVPWNNFYSAIFDASLFSTLINILVTKVAGGIMNEEKFINSIFYLLTTKYRYKNCIGICQKFIQLINESRLNRVIDTNLLSRLHHGPNRIATNVSLPWCNNICKFFTNIVFNYNFP